MTRARSAGGAVIAGRRILSGVALTLALAFIELIPAPADAAALRGGAPLSTRYTVEDYPGGPSMLAVLGDPRGMVWAGNIDGLVRFASGHFEMIELPGRSSARALAIGPDGRLYVGSYDRIGVVETSPDGDSRYVELRDRFKASSEPGSIGNVWDVLADEDAVYFRAEGKLMRLGADGRTDEWPLPETLRGVQLVDGTIYGRLEGEGLARFVDGRFVLIGGSEAFRTQPFIAMVGSDEGLVAVTNDGFHALRGERLQKLDTPFDEVLAASSPYTGLRLNDGSFVVGTSVGELLHFDASLKLIGRHALDGHPVVSLGTDREGGVWVATEGSLMRVLLPSPWSMFGARDGLAGTYVDTAYDDGGLWVATTQGLYRRTDALSQFKRNPAVTGEAWDLEPTERGTLIAGRHGLYFADGENVVRVSDVREGYVVKRSRYNVGVAYAITDSQLLVLAATRDGFRENGRLDLPGSSLSSIVETAAGEIWLGDYRGQPWRVDTSVVAKPTAARVAETAKFRFSPEHGSYLFMLDDRLYGVSGTSVQLWTGTAFEDSEAQGLAPLVRDRAMELIVRDAPNGTYALTTRQLFHRGRNSESWERIYIDSPLARGFTDLVAEPSGVLRLITWSGVLQFDPDVTVPAKPELFARLRRAEARDAEGNVTRLPVTTTEALVVPARQSMRFVFELLSAEPAREFRYRLAGAEEAWRPWSSEAELALPLLPPGEYALELEARLKSGRTARPLRYPFVIEPRWYEHNGMRAAAALVLALLVLGASRWYAVVRVRRVEQRTRKLESVITERTRELERANTQLARLAALDGLTGVPNRRGFDAFLDEHWTRCRERGEPLALLMIDVDHFKQFNDRHGHLAGDEALRALALELSRFAGGEHEILARFGGEEFAMVIANATVERAHERAEYIRQHFDERAERDGLTLSIGVAALVPETGVPPRRLIDLADAALYQAKRSGRNRVEMHRGAA